MPYSSTTPRRPSCLFGDMGRLSENSVVVIKNKSHSVTAEIVVPEWGAEGVIIAQGATAYARPSGPRIQGRRPHDGVIEPERFLVMTRDLP